MVLAASCMRKFGNGDSSLQIGPSKIAQGVAVDSQDRVYAFTRETTGMVVFDPEGNFLGTWGRDQFKRPHGIFIGPDDAIYCADDWGHSIRKFTTDGELLMEIETKDHPADTGYVWGDQPSAIHRAGPAV